ncbi:class I SAM-dependent methyltransferase [Paenibacillus sp. R14(2021)]|uniref:class I SAM-dependent methyltransferase n=1 Tax=Paenibacillus sp. R14(2021) TaxID=2859228 RepID=UPI001C616A2E|nr:class I SAM-dependent methyltransferase [Paenibacillus sp. R14(2021)]
MMQHDMIYQSEAERYELLVSKEDVDRNLLRAIQSIMPALSGIRAADIGAGTGKLTKLLAPHVQSILATDASTAMLEVAARNLKAARLTNWQIEQASHDSLPLANHSIDLLTAGWTICYSASTNVPNWQSNLQVILQEIARVVRPGGTAIIFENFGTGTTEANPPAFLTSYYSELEQTYGFEHTYIRTDFEFDTVDDAIALTDFFFGTWLSEQVTNSQSPRVPGSTGIWWKRY